MESRGVESGTPPSELNIIQKILGLIFGGNDPEREKKRLLKGIKKQLKRQRYKFYRPGGKDALPALARFFFGIYRVVGPAQALLQNAAQSTALRAMTIEYHLTEDQRKLKDKLDEESIREEGKSLEPKELADAVKRSVIDYFGAFDGNLARTVNGTYNSMRLFINFVNFDYYFVLRKFDSSMQENNYSSMPKFDSISAEYVVDDIKDFLEVFLPLESATDWEKVWDVLRVYKGIDVVNRDAWQKLMSAIDDVRKSDVLTLIIQHADGDPYYKPTMRVPKEKVVEPYLSTLKTQTEGVVQKLLNERRNQRVDQLAGQVFGTPAVRRVKNYTEAQSQALARKAPVGFAHVSAINYLKAFLVDYFKKDVREVVRDLLLVRGKWSTNMVSQQISDAFHQLMTIAEQVVKFDDSLGDEGELGMKIRKAMGRIVDRDKSTAKLLKQQVDDVNTKAATLINQAAQNLISLGKQLKELIEDHDKANHELLMNWKELSAASEEPLKERMVEIYKKIYYFIQLLQIFVKTK